MTSVSNFQYNAYICDWLMRVDTQYDKDTPKKIQEADKDRAKESLGLKNTTYNYFFSSPQPAVSRGWFSSGDTITNSNNTTVYHTHVHNDRRVGPSSESEDKSTEEANKKKKTKEEKPDWKGIAVIGAVSTAVVGISLFVYARLSKAAEGAVNYLENTKRINLWAETIATCSNSGIDQDQIARVAYIAKKQLGIDQRDVDKITNYKYSILTTLVGTLVAAGGGIAILASPALATAGTTAAVAGIALCLLAGMYAAYNCGMHWSDEKEGRNALDQIKQSISIPDLIKSFNPNTQTQNHHSTSSASDYHFEGPPPSYDESQFIYNQRVNPNRIYPDLSGFIPSAPPYESL